ncbi:hypothetical protein CDCA_CDCA07G2215 [Cyanidium caldarium]|uniref:DNA 3'-5' helicase n=1 Tax=Cyanidium caldarium TaxID=2771 RepID=A0AAV9IVR7_CYACA|nr:hypothetical protein CDCA_CDCA07G2215 [Cyanidium caldarium]
MRRQIAEGTRALSSRAPLRERKGVFTAALAFSLPPLLGFALKRAMPARKSDRSQTVAASCSRSALKLAARTSGQLGSRAAKFVKPELPPPPTASESKPSPAAQPLSLQAQATSDDQVPDWLHGQLNEEQLAVVTASPEAPILVFAGPGSGKTRVLTYRIAYLIAAHGVAPRQVLAVTFTNKAANEMKSRVLMLLQQQQLGLGGDDASEQQLASLRIGTFHSTCAHVLRLYGHQMGLPSDFVIYDTSDSEKLIALIMEQEFHLESTVMKPSAVRITVSKLKTDAPNPFSSLEDPAIEDYERRVRAIMEAYQLRMREANALDFDDLLLECVNLLEQCPSVRVALQRKWRYILVDESQDSNRFQYDFVRLASTDVRSGALVSPVFMVGDADQSIYGWRGADLHQFVRIRDELPDCQVFFLELNYRSTEPIVRLAQHIIEQDAKRLAPEKQMKTHWSQGQLPAVVHCPDSRAEGMFAVTMAQYLVEEYGISWDDMAVMYRANSRSRGIEEECVRAGIPYRILGGMRFYERLEIKDTLAYLRLLGNVDDVVNFERVINTPPRGLGDVSVNRLLEWAHQLHLSPMRALELLAHLASDSAIATEAGLAAEQLPPSAPVAQLLQRGEVCLADSALNNRQLTAYLQFYGQYCGWRALLQRKRQAPGGEAVATLTHVVSQMLDDVGYREHLKTVSQSTGNAALRSAHDVHRERLENIQALLQAITKFEDTVGGDAQTLQEVLQLYLEEVALVSRSEEEYLSQQPDGEGWQGRLSLMTLHASKGLEFAVVCIAGAEDGTLPHFRCLDEPDRMDEERRLLYVGVTRAKSFLFITWDGLPLSTGDDKEDRALFEMQRFRGGRPLRPLSAFLMSVPTELLQRRQAKQWMREIARSHDWARRSPKLDGMLSAFLRRVDAAEATSSSRSPYKASGGRGNAPPYFQRASEYRGNWGGKYGKRSSSYLKSSSSSSSSAGPRPSSMSVGRVVHHEQYGKGVIVSRPRKTGLVSVVFFGDDVGKKLVPQGELS